VDPLRHFSEVWALDFEFGAPPGARPQPRCLVARELRTRRLVLQWLDGGSAPPAPPYATGPDTLLVAYYASAEWGCHLALDWPMPLRVLDLFTEFRNLTNGRPPPHGAGLLGALMWHGLDAMGAAEKQQMRDLALCGGPYTPAERSALLAYCQEDVDALARLLPRMLPRIDLPRALLRGRYTVAAARMEWAGVPLDVLALDDLCQNWGRIKGRLVRAVDRDYSVFVRTDLPAVDPKTAFGAAVTEAAFAWEVDPQRLAAAALNLWRQEREAGAERREAVGAARRRTGLSVARVRRIEDVGGDHLAVPGLDVAARELAGSYPALGIGRGYDGEDGYDDTDHAARLWDVLRREQSPVRPRHDPGLLRDAALWLSHNLEDEDGVFRFSERRWAAWLDRHGIHWPRLPSGRLALDDDTFREMARAYPAEVGPIREVRNTLGQMRLADLACGPDGRNRCLLSMFRSVTGRNQPSNSRFIFGPSCWLRSLIKPEPGRAVAYVDWSQQELAIAARLSGDLAMQECYRSGDFYLTFAKMARAVPADATKETHGAERDRLKTVALGVLYGQGPEGMAARIGCTVWEARELLRLHRQTFPAFWRWSDALVLRALATGRLRTCFGWTLHVGKDTNPRTIRNFPMQAHGAEMLRLACCLATERGVTVCAPVHDALLVEGPAGDIEAVVARTQEAMEEASALVLPGFPLRTDSKIVPWPGRYLDPRGQRMWDTVRGLSTGLTPGAGARGRGPDP
jgi:hypothetical protein